MDTQIPSSLGRKTREAIKIQYYRTGPRDRGMNQDNEISNISYMKKVGKCTDFLGLT